MTPRRGHELRSHRRKLRNSKRLEALSRVDAAEVLAALGSSEHGLTAEAAEAALEKHGPNVLRLEEQKTILSEITGRAKRRD